MSIYDKNNIITKYIFATRISAKDYKAHITDNTVIIPQLAKWRVLKHYLYANPLDNFISWSNEAKLYKKQKRKL